MIKWIFGLFILAIFKSNGQNNNTCMNINCQSSDILWQRNVERFCRYTKQELSIPPSVKTNVQNVMKPWWMYYWEPNWSCPFEERVMWLPPNSMVTAGDGGKWTCNVPELTHNNDCLVYSFGSAGDFSFEVGLLELLQGQCEIHTFDITNLEPIASYPPQYFHAIHKHMWGLGVYDETIRLIERGVEKDVQMKSLQTIMRELGHQGRTLHILKIDIEGGEFGLLNNHTFWREFDQSGAKVEQLLFELHFEHNVGFGAEIMETGANIDQFFRSLTYEGFVLFHKEINMLAPSCSEFSMWRLNIDCPPLLRSAKEVVGKVEAEELGEEIVQEIATRQLALLKWWDHWQT